MKTKSLSKAPVGHVKVVMEPNQEGYVELMGVKVGDETLGTYLQSIKNAINDEKEKREQAEQENASLKLEVGEQQAHIKNIEGKLAQLELCIEETIKGLITR